ncbi:unnamed protein product [Rotaria socialis]
MCSACCNIRHKEVCFELTSMIYLRQSGVVQDEHYNGLRLYYTIDFHTNPKLKEMVLELLQDMLFNNHLIAAEHKAAVAIIKQLETAEIDEKNEQLHILLYPKQV